MAWYDRLALAAYQLRSISGISLGSDLFLYSEAFGLSEKDFKPSRKQAREKEAKYKLCQKQDEEAELSYKR